LFSRAELTHPDISVWTLRGGAVFFTQAESDSRTKTVAPTFLRPHRFGFHHWGYVNKTRTVNPQKDLHLQHGIRNALAPDTPQIISSVTGVGVLNKCLLSEKCSTYCNWSTD